MPANPTLDLRGLKPFDRRDLPIGYGPAAKRPAANLTRPKSAYVETDTGCMYYSDGVTWKLIDCASGPSLNDLILRQSPLGFWKLNESSGVTAADSSGNGRDLPVPVGKSAPVWGHAPGPPGEQTAGFSGLVNGLLLTSFPAITGDMTAEVWFKFDGTVSDVNRIIGQGDAFGSPGWFLAWNGASSSPANRAYFQANGVGSITGDNTLVVGNWYHIAFVKSGATCRLYVNGLAQTGTVAMTGTSGLWIGSTALSGVLNGDASYAAAYDRALSGAELLQHYNSAILPGRTVTAAYTINPNTDRVIFANGTFTVTLPTAKNRPGVSFTVKNVGTGIITVSAPGTEKIDGAGAPGTVSLAAANQSITVASDGINWFSIADWGVAGGGGGYPGSYPIVNADISATAAIAKSKLAALNIVNADVDVAAAIAESKLALASDAAAATASRRTLGTGALQAAAGNDARLSDQRTPLDNSVTSAKILDGEIVNADISATAAIAKSKLAALGIVDADVAAGAAIAKSKLAALAIVDADVAAAAAIALSKLAGYPTDATKFARGDGTWAATGATPIFDSTLAAVAASIDVTPIATTYRHLFLVLSARGDTAALNTSVSLRLNNNATALYFSQFGQDTDAAHTFGGQVAAATSAILGLMPANTATASYFGTMLVEIPDYTNATKNRTWSSRSYHLQGSATGGQMSRLAGGAFASAVAVTRVTLLPAAGNFAIGTRLTIYGMG